MSENTAITWTRHTFNAWWGCFKISPGCKHCYAAALDHRLGGEHWGEDAPRKRNQESYWEKPIAWARKAAALGERHTVFTASMSDWAEDRPDLVEDRSRLFDLVKNTADSLDWLFLTKRPEAGIRFLPWVTSVEPFMGTAPWPNVWLGASVENGDYNWRIDVIRSVPAAVRFVSWEPALGPIDHLIPSWDGIHWLVCGDESGRVRRPAEVDWFRRARDACEAKGIAFHMKQWAGADAPGIEGVRKGGKINLPVLDGRVHGAFPEVR